MSIKNELLKHQRLLLEQRLMYMNIATELNTKQRQVMNENADGSGLARAVVTDIAGQLTSTYFGLNNMNITADQLVRYMMNFSYDQDNDPLAEEIARKDALNATSSDDFRAMSNSEINSLLGSEKIFGKSKDRSVSGQQASQNASNGTDYLTGNKSKMKLEADHVMARSVVSAPEWMSSEGRQEMRDITEGPSNFQMINWKGNRIKGANRVYQDNNGNVVGVTYSGKQPEGTIDITATATVKQRAEAFNQSIQKGLNYSYLPKKSSVFMFFKN